MFCPRQCIEWLLTVKLIERILMWTLDNSALLGQMLPPGWKGNIERCFGFFFSCFGLFGFLFLHTLTSILTELDPHFFCWGRNQTHHGGDQQECKSEQKLIPAHWKISRHKVHTRDSVSGKLSSGVKDERGDTSDAHDTQTTFSQSLVSLFLLRTFLSVCCVKKKYKDVFFFYSFELSEWVTEVAVSSLSE